MLNRKNLEKFIDFFQLALIYGWLSLLQPVANTDTYYSVYILVAILAVVCRCKLGQERLENLQRKNQWQELLLAGILSLMVVLANYQLSEPQLEMEGEAAMLLLLISELVLFGGGICVAYPIIRWVDRFFPLSGTSSSANHPFRIFTASFLFIVLVDLGYLSNVYPGILTRDSVSTVKQILGLTPYNNVMPYWHTKLVEVFFDFGMWLTGNINGAVATFHVAQILMMAACLSFAVVTVYQLRVPKWQLVVLFVFYALTPCHIAYSVTLWKDVLFAGALLLMTVALFRTMRGIGKNRWINQLLAIIGAVGFSLLRTNGWYALAVTAAVMIMVDRGRIRGMAKQLLLVLLATWFLLNPLLNILQIDGMELTEAFAVPMQQVARVVSEGCVLEEEDIRLLEEIFDMEQMAEQYTPGTVDPVKFNTFRYDKKGYICQNWLTYVRLYLKIGLRYPGEYWKAWIDLTKGFWNAGYVSYVYDHSCEGEELGIYRPEGNALAARLYYVLFLYWEKTIPLQFTASIGLYIWVLIVLLTVACLKKWKERVLFIPLMVLAIGLWLGTPVCTEFRYGYPFVLCIPFLLCVCSYVPKELVDKIATQKQ